MTDTCETIRFPAVRSRPLLSCPFRSTNPIEEQIHAPGPHKSIIIISARVPQIAAALTIETYSDLMRNVRLLSHQILNLAHTLLIQQTILCPHCQRQWHTHGIKVCWDGYETGMASHRCIHTPNIAPTARFLLPMRL